MRYEALLAVNGEVAVARDAKNGDAIFRQGGRSKVVIENGTPKSISEQDGQELRCTILVPVGHMLATSSETVEGQDVTFAFRLRGTGQHRAKAGDKLSDFTPTKNKITGPSVAKI